MAEGVAESVAAGEDVTFQSCGWGMRAQKVVGNVETWKVTRFLCASGFVPWSLSKGWPELAMIGENC